MLNERKNDNPKFEALLNSNLVCRDCKFREEIDGFVATCEKFVDMKPKSVLFEKADCPEYVKGEQWK